MPTMIVSGGQTGVDRAALDAALACGIAIGGWCPAGRWAEDTAIDVRYPLKETPSNEPSQRTEWNVRDSDGTLVLHLPDMQSPGTELTKQLAQKMHKPLLIIELPGDEDAVIAVSQWLQEHSIKTLNVAGPRESGQPGVYDVAYYFLLKLFRM